MALPAAVFLCAYYFFILNHAFKLLPYVELALLLLVFLLTYKNSGQPFKNG